MLTTEVMDYSDSVYMILNNLRRVILVPVEAFEQARDIEKIEELMALNLSPVKAATKIVKDLDALGV